MPLSPAPAELFRLLMDNVQEYALFVMGPDRRVTTWNAGAERILGYPEAEAIGMLVDVIFTDEDRAAGAPQAEEHEALRSGNAADDRWHVRKDGTRFWASGMMVALRDEAGELRGFAKILRDNTRRKRAEDLLRELNETLERRVREQTGRVRALASRLATAEQEERRRLAHVLHDDLQQHLHALAVTHSLIARAPSDDSRGRLLDRAEQTLDEALTLTRSLAVELSPAVLETDRLGDVLRWLAERKRERLGLAVAVEGDADVGDPSLRTLVYHLVREALFNVAKHAGTGRARVVIEEAGGDVVVRVEDDGAGFDVAGLGTRGAFGLASVRERLELVGGALAVESAPGAGTRITLTVPQAEEEGHRVGPHGAGSPSRTARPQGEGVEPDAGAECEEPVEDRL